MKGYIIYSSLTGNTKKAAEKLAEHLSDLADWHVVDLSSGPDIQDADLLLVGAWVDQGLPEKKALAWIEHLDKQMPTGLFVTLGAMPDSFHGQKVAQGLADMLKDRQSLGYGLLPGLVDAKLLARVHHIPDHVLSPDIRQQMIEAGEKSRWATEEEYQTLADIFRQNILGWKEKGE